MRRTRKILRFLRTIEHSTKIRKEVGALIKEGADLNTLVVKMLVILEHLFTVLFYLFDHRVFLGEIEVISKDYATTYYPKSMMMYKWQNIVGALKCLAEVAVIVMEGKYEGELLDMDNGSKVIKGKMIEFLKNILDIFVASYYLNKPAGKAGRIGVIGMITSIIGLCKELKVI